MAYVLFMDLVSYSTLPMDLQSERIQQLQEVVRSTPEYQRAQQADQINYALPVQAATELPALPGGGLTGSADALKVKGAATVRHALSSSLNASVYAFVRSTTRRNIYRIPLQ